MLQNYLKYKQAATGICEKYVSFFNNYYRVKPHQKSP